MKSGIRLAFGAFVLAMGFALAGCAGSGNQGTSEAMGTPEAAGTGVQLTVKNEQRTEAVIWVLIDGSRQRLGQVRAYDEGTFLIPMDRTRMLRMEFQIYGGPTCLTREVSRQPGQSASYTIPTDIRLFDAVCR